MAKYVVTWREKDQPEPEQEFPFPSLQEALIFLRNEIRWLAEDQADPAVGELLWRLAMRLENGPWYENEDTFEVADWVFSVKREGPSLFEAGVIR